MQTPAAALRAEVNRRSDEQAAHTQGSGFGGAVQAGVEIAQAHQAQGTDEGQQRAADN